jgi:hypothetical protein
MVSFAEATRNNLGPLLHTLAFSYFSQQQSQPTASSSLPTPINTINAYHNTKRKRQENISV